MKKRVLSALLALVMVSFLSSPALAWESPGTKYPAFEEYFNFYSSSTDPDTRALTSYVQDYLAEHPDFLDTFDPDAYFDANLSNPGMGITKLNWFAGQLPSYTEEHFRAEMLNDCLTRSYGVWRDQLYYNGLRVTVDGTPVPFHIYNGLDDQEAYPVAENQRILVPARAIAEALNFTVEYLPETSSVVCAKDGRTVTFVLGALEYTVAQDDVTETFTLDVTPYAQTGRTYLPVRALGEALGCTVTWKQEFSTAALHT